jgi:hypothetical protein
MLVYNDTSFTFQRSTENCCLSGQIDLTGFSYAVTDEQGNCLLIKTVSYPKAVLSHDDWTQAVNAVFLQEPLLSQQYKSTKWVFCSNKATLIPAGCANENHLRTCLEYAAPFDELDEIHYRPLPAHEAVCVFALPNPAVNVILKYQRDAQFFHPQILLLSMAETLDGATKAVLHITPELADVALFAGGRLMLSNTYPVQAFTDVLYNLLAAIKLHSLPLDDFTLYYMGQFTEADENLLRRYFRNTGCLFGNDRFLLMGRENATMYHLLLTLAQCE